MPSSVSARAVMMAREKKTGRGGGETGFFCLVRQSNGIINITPYEVMK
jgi:hypothetical protein